jgi:hypothetical protein
MSYAQALGRYRHQEAIASADSSFWDKLGSHFAQAAAPPDPSALSAQEFGAQRAALGIRDASDIVGAGTHDPSGLPDWRHPPQIATEQTEMDGYAATRSVRDTTVLHGFAPADPRSHTSPYSL